MVEEATLSAGESGAIRLRRCRYSRLGFGSLQGWILEAFDASATCRFETPCEPCLPAAQSEPWTQPEPLPGERNRP